MPNRLPSLTALRTFEAAARHMSFSKAGEELAVTPAAVGFQIKQLEEELGAPLFIRKHRAVELTRMGQKLAQKLAPAFATIRATWHSLDKPEFPDALRITAGDNVALDWVLPLTDAAKAVRPGPEIVWDASRNLRDLDGGGWDVGLRTCLEPDDRYFREPVIGKWFTPLMRPEVARHIRKPADMLDHDLINTENEAVKIWPAFLRLLHLPSDPIFAVTCSRPRDALELAAKGNGIAMGGSFLAEQHIEAESLVGPIPKAIIYKSQIWLICAKGRENSEEILWLRNALHASADKIRERVKDLELFELDGSPLTRSL